MRNKKVKYVLHIVLLMLIMSVIIGCGYKGKSKETGKENSTQKVDTVVKKKEAKNTAETDKTVQNKAVKRIVDGYDIGSATSGHKLKDLYKKYFTIGLAMCGSDVSNSTVKSKALCEIIKYHANNTTFTNLMKPSYLLDQNGCINNIKKGIKTPAVKFDSIKENMDFCKANNIKVRGHVLVWHNQVPGWFFRDGYQDSGDLVDRDTMLVRMESYIKQVLEYTQKEYPGVIYCWDVVNEAVENTDGWYETKSGFNIRTKFDNNDNLWYKVVGADYVEKAFVYARKYAAKDVKLYYNDYNTYMPYKTDKICALLSYLKKKGLVDGIGMQGNMDLNYPGIYAGNDNILTEIRKYAKLGLEIQFTELTIKPYDKTSENAKKQAERYKSLFTMLIQLDNDNGGPANIVNVTMFGVMDEYLFYDKSVDTEYGRIFDGNLQPKPAFYSIRSVGENAKNIKTFKIPGTWE